MFFNEIDEGLWFYAGVRPGAGAGQSAAVQHRV